MLCRSGLSPRVYDAITRPSSLCASRWFSESTPKPFTSIPGPMTLPVVKSTLPVMWTVIKHGQENFLHQLYRDFGSIMKLEISTFDMVVLSDPLEAVKVIQNEGKYPHGSVSDIWPLKKMLEENTPSESLFRGVVVDGEVWKRTRSVVGPSLVPPRVAREYIPAIAKAARSSSKDAQQWASSFDQYIARVAFDMFSALSIGEFCKATSKTEAIEGTEEFVSVALDASHRLGALLNDPLGPLKTKQFNTYASKMSHAMELAQEMSGSVYEKLENGNGTTYNESSYLNKLRLKGHSFNEICDAVNIALIAGVDTTAYVMCWLLLNLAQNPEKQQTLREELESVLKGGDLSAENLDNLPYLKACIRESHRLTPPAVINLQKQSTIPLVLEGYEVPAGQTVTLNLTAIPWDEKYVDSPKEYIPERFLPEAVQARKGTEKEIIDHRLFADPFSSGARMCPGARVAHLEIMCFAARFFQDWKLHLLPDQKWQVKIFLLQKADPFPKFELEPVRAS